MKSITKAILISLLCFALGACDYLDVVPDNIATVDGAFAMRNSAEQYLFTVYSYLPNHSDFQSNPGMVTGDETWFFYPPRDFNATAWEIAQGNQNVVSPLLNYWDGNENGTPMFRAIRDANIFLENIDDVRDMTDFEKNQWIAEVKFLKAYYHFWLLRMYGPIPIIRENLHVASEEDEVQVTREPVDDVVDYIVELIDEAAEYLPDVVQNEVSDLGRITKPIALSIKARLLVMAASPLFNGNNDYSSFATEDGIPLINSDVDPTKWERAAEAVLEAIEINHEVGAELHRFQPPISAQNISDSTQVKMDIRTVVTEKWNTEIIWGDTNGMAGHIQNIATPMLFPTLTTSNSVRGMYAPTMRMAELFYTENGVPITEDVTWDYSGRYDLRRATADERYYISDGYETAALHFDREPRFYANLGFDGAIWYGNGRLNDDDTWHIESKAGQSAARASLSNYSITGYYNHKVVNYTSSVSGNTYTVESYPWPVMRLADLYLLYAEVLNEIQGPGPEVYRYLDLIRQRAGLPGVLEAWEAYTTQPDKPRSREGLREIIHQERLIELAFEGQRYWDLIRWKKAADVMNGPIRGWDIEQEEASAYYQPIVIFNQAFSQRDYFWPLSENAILTNRNLVQNPGW